MTWVKLDDSMGDHRKVKRTLRNSRPAVALHFLGILHCSRYLTDGFVGAQDVEDILPVARERAVAVDALMENGLWEPRPEGYAIHDYLDHNPTREKVLAQRAADAARKLRGRQSESRGNADGVPTDSSGTPDGIQTESDRPVPSRPVPSVSEREGERASATFDDPVVAEVERVLRTCERLQFDPLLAGVTNVIAAYPAADHVQAARIAVANASDPNYRTTDAGKALRYAIQELERNGPRPRRAAVESPRMPWDGALREVVEGKDAA